MTFFSDKQRQNQILTERKHKANDEKERRVVFDDPRVCGEFLYNLQGIYDRLTHTGLQVNIKK